MVNPAPTTAELLQGIPDLVPCPACLVDPDAALHGERVEAVYCPHRRSGLAWHAGLFTMYAPISLAEYRSIIAALEVRLESRAPSQAAN